MDMGKLTSYVIFLLVLYLAQRDRLRTVCPLRAKNCSWNRADQRDIDGVRHHESFEGVSRAPADQFDAIVRILGQIFRPHII